MKKMTVLALGLLLFVPSLAFSDSLSLRMGYYFTRAMSNSYLNSHPDSLWTIEFQQMSFRQEDFRGGIYGLSYEYFLNRNVNIAITVDSFRRNQLGDYLDYDQTDFENYQFAFPIDAEPAVIPNWYYISHSLTVSSTPVQLSVKFLPLGRRARIVPFLGGGGTMSFWSARMFGEQVDFSGVDELNQPAIWYYDYETDTANLNPTDISLMDVEIFPVVPLYAKEHGIAFGWHAFAGVQVPIGYRATIEAEVRYHSLRGKMHRVFQDFEPLELGGLALTAGLTFWF